MSFEEFERLALGNGDAPRVARRFDLAPDRDYFDGDQPRALEALLRQQAQAYEQIGHLRHEVEALREQQEAFRRNPAQPMEPDISNDADDIGEQDSQLPPPAMLTRIRRHPARLVLALIAAALLSVAGLRFWNYLQSYEWTDDAQIDGHLDPISTRIDGTVVRAYVENTQRVKEGDALVDIDPRDYQVALDSARAKLVEARAALNAAHQDYEVAAARLAQSEADNLKAQRDVARYRQLFAQAVISRDDYEEEMRVGKVDAAGVVSARATLAAAARVIAQRQAAVAAAEAALDQARLNLSYTHIVAPAAGVVGEKTVEVGQRVQPGEALLSITPLDDIWITADFRETQLRRIHRGQRVTVHVDATGRDYRAYVEGLPGASGELYSLLPPENATGNYVKVVQRLPVRIRLYPGQDQDHRLRPGMSVEPTVWLNSGTH